MLRQITLATGLAVALSATACASSRSTVDRSTTTTSAEVPRPAPAARVDDRPIDTTTTTATTMPATDDAHAGTPTGPIDPRDETANPDDRADSFETSGGSSGLGNPGHRKVPGQDLWDVGPSPTIRTETPAPTR